MSDVLFPDDSDDDGDIFNGLIVKLTFVHFFFST